MSADQIAIFAVLSAALGLFVIDRWRYDVVALAALFASVMLGIVPAADAFSGLANPVVTTVAAVLVLSAVVRKSGLLEAATGVLSTFIEKPRLQVAILVTMVASFSAFMNNVGALALFLPIAIQAAQKAGRPPSELLMPLAFGSLLGGLVTLIGTPPNILIAGIRERYTGAPFEMFDFAPVGLAVAAVGILYLAFAWRLIPVGRKGPAAPEDVFRIDDYIAEVKVIAASKAIDKRVSEVEEMGDGDLAVVGLVRNEARRLVPSGRMVIREGDVLVVETDPVTLKKVTDAAKLELVGEADLEGDALRSDEVGVAEAVVTRESELVGRSPEQLRLRSRFGVNLLAVSRHGRPIRARLSRTTLKEGDVVVLQGNLEHMSETLGALGCLPLAQRNLQLGKPRRYLLPLAILGGAVAVAVAGLMPIEISFLGAVVLVMLLRLLTLKELYEAVDWPVVVLLAAMLPVAEALEKTGGAQLIASGVAAAAEGLPPFAVLTVVLVATMAVTPVLNNGATVLLMAPIAAGIATQLDLGLDALLMAVAIGASSDFLTPIGHQSNTLVMGPGGYKFSDYWRLGLPLSVLVVLVTVPMLLLVWGSG